ncbi:MAG: hypothetical protein IKI59_00505 [Clostridia bacterium]|nr:hypothetical protein [Clostridia bacterium]
MNRQQSLGEYRAIDLGLFGVMLAVFETILVTAATKLFPAEPYTVSLAAAITAIVLMRWGAFAAIHAVLGGLVFCIASGATVQQYGIYCVGNLFALGALLLFRWLGKEGIRADALRSMAFALIVQLLMQLGRMAVALALGNPIAVCAGFFTTDVISDLFTVVIIWIARRLDGVFEDQKHYLIRLQKENEKDKGMD